MNRSWFRRLLGTGVVLAGSVGIAVAALNAQAPTGQAVAPAPASSGQSLLAQAIKAEADFQFDVATDRLYTLLLDQPGTTDALAARLRLAKLLALSGDWPAAILECQALRDESAADSPLRGHAIEMATALARRLRAASGTEGSYFATFEPLQAKGLPATDEPRTIVFEGENRFVVVDEGAGRVVRAGADAGSTAQAPQEPSAATVMPDGTVLVFGKTGLSGIGTTQAVQLSGTIGGRMRQLKKVRSMAALSNGDLLVIDKDYDGLVRCRYPSGTCTAVGTVGRQRVVKVGASDWCYLLDERGQALRVLDANQNPIASFGPSIGTARLERVEDIAVDGVHGLYLLDRDLKRVTVVTMRAAPDGKVSGTVVGSFPVPQDGANALKNPWAIGVAPGGSLVVAGKGAPRVMRLR